MNKTVKVGLALLSSLAISSVASATISFVVNNGPDGNKETVGNINSPFLDKKK